MNTDYQSSMVWFFICGLAVCGLSLLVSVAWGKICRWGDEADAQELARRVREDQPPAFTTKKQF